MDLRPNALKNFRLQIPTTVFFGLNEFERVKKAASATGKKALIIIGMGSAKKLGYLQKLEAFLDEEGIKHEVFEGIEPNPKSKTINKAGQKASEIGADMIIALGGGSVMDGAKGAAIIAKNAGDIWDYCYTKDKKAKKPGSALALICIPTLAATGSEVNGGSVITNTDTMQKSVIHSSVIIPKFAIIDPLLTMSVPKTSLVDGAVDIICHCIESYLSCSENVCIPDYATLGISRTVKLSIERILEDQKDLAARTNLSWASSLAMIGIFSGRQGGWPIHEIEHALSGIYDISHGLGLAWLMPSLMEFNKDKNGEKIKRFVGFFIHENTSYYSDCHTAIRDFKTWLKDIGALRDLESELKKRIDIDAVANMTLDIYSNSEGYIFGAVPMYKKDIIWVLKNALG
jgi:alcohol dehydrogenase YqhD (iron-dependent ADH family)